MTLDDLQQQSNRMDNLRQFSAAIFKRFAVLMVSFASMELLFPYFDRALNVLRFGQASMDAQRGIEMIIFYFFHFIYVSRLFGIEFQHQHFTLHFFASGVIRYIYQVYGRVYARHFQAIASQAASELWRFCIGLQRKTVGMIAVLMMSVLVMVLIRLDRKRTVMRRTFEKKREAIY